MTSFLLAVFLLTLFGALLGIAIRAAIRSIRRDKIASAAVSCLWAAAAIGALVLSAPVWLIVALCLSLAGALLGLSAYVRDYHRTLSDLVSNSHVVRQFGLDNFDRLDGDHDGNIGLGDLIAAENDDALSERERELARFMRRFLPRIGHATSCTVIYGTVGGPAMPVYHYGISRADLERFPDRAYAEFAEEFDTEFKGR